MAFKDLRDVLVDELKDLLNAEKQLLRALPKLAKAASNEQLKEALQDHLEVTKGQVDRLENVFSSIGETAKGKKCEAMEGLIAEGDSVLEHKKESCEDALDAAIIAACQRVEHYEISGYGSVRTFAEVLGLDEAAELLQQTLDEESEANEKLTQIAKEVNAAAAEGQEEEAEMVGTNGRPSRAGKTLNSPKRSRST